ncbi:response regulator [Adhaeribacter aquaticus]|uniref:response regulator n=1 Tax=Adhaeribacter aquaticus TaxID=299567 RepID=UPI000478B56D|nr:response regulator [Adhaeribacter aquaticus]
MLNKVLLVDDDRICLRLLEYWLINTSFARELIPFTDGKQAFEYLKSNADAPIEQAPNLIFLDLDMPEMTGWEFIKIFPIHFPHLLNQTKIVVISSTMDTKDIEDFELNPLVIKFIMKPLNKSGLNELKTNPELEGFFKNNHSCFLDTIT